MEGVGRWERSVTGVEVGEMGWRWVRYGVEVGEVWGGGR